MGEENRTRLAGEGGLPAGTEAIVAAVALLAIFSLGVYADPLGPAGLLILVPFAALVATYVLAFKGLVRRLT